MASIVAFLLLWGCGSSERKYKGKLNVNLGPTPELSFDRYEEVLFQLDTANFQQELLAIQERYQPFLAGDLTDLEAVNYLKDFAMDTLSVFLYHKVEKLYPDLDAVKEVVLCEFRHLHYYYPEIHLPKRVYTCVSGVHPEIPSVIISGDDLVLSLDWYLDRDEVYDRIGMPRYRSERTGLGNLAKDLGEQLFVTYVQRPHRQSNLLEEMVQEGRKDFFIEAMYPGISDEALLGYTAEQLAWAESNEGNIWADMVGNQRLFESGLETYRTFLADGPFTNEYSHEAPPRLGEFIGLQIVRSYMDAHDVTFQKLMQETDVQGLFQESGYKPKK